MLDTDSITFRGEYGKRNETSVTKDSSMHVMQQSGSLEKFNNPLETHSSRAN